MDINTLPIEEIVAHLQTQVDRLQAQILDAEKYVSKFTDSSIKRIEDSLAELKHSQIAATEKTSDAATQATQAISAAAAQATSAIQAETVTSQKALKELRLALGSLNVFETQIESFSATLDQMAEHIKTMAQHINDVASKQHETHVDHRDTVKSYIDLRFDALKESVFKAVSRQIIEQVTPEVVAKALVKQILVTRPAHQHELKNGDCLAVRQATLQEIREGKPAA